MEGISIRPITPDELGPFYRNTSRALGFPQPNEEHLEGMRKAFDASRSLAAFDRDELVGSAHSHLFEWTVPGGATVPAAGVTAVGVATTHRRRGILSQMMRRQLAEARERDEPAAILLASESVIYGRYGYGLSTTIVELEIDPRLVSVAAPRPESGRVRFVDDDTADKVLPDVYDRWRRSQHGAINRSQAWYWDFATIDRKPGRTNYAVYENAAGEPEGYVAYGLRGGWDAGLPNHVVSVNDLVSTSADAYAALWHHLLAIDLVSKIELWNRPPDEPLRHMLSDPRRIKFTRMGDLLWARILDVPAMLSARTYAVPGRIVLDVRDPQFGEVSGRYELENGECGATTADAEVELGIADLGCVYQGDTSFSQLARVGRIVEKTRGALARADTMFATGTAPWCNTSF